MSRIQISLSTPTLDQLRAIANSTGEPVARAAARMLMAGLAGGGSPARARIQPPSTDVDGAADEPRRPSWLEPLDEEERRLWLRQTWGDVLALYNRYQGAFENLPEAWWRKSNLLETVCALAAWRLEIDWGGRDPREELAFQFQLADFRETLHRLPGGVASKFRPGAPHDDWLTGW
jgi:hypothetical protein